MGSVAGRGKARQGPSGRAASNGHPDNGTPAEGRSPPKKREAVRRKHKSARMKTPDKRVTKAARPFDLSADWIGNRCKVVAMLGGEAVHIDTFDVTKADRRAKFARAVNGKCQAVTPGAVEAALMKVASAGRPPANPAPPPAEGYELDVSLVRRPELFHANDVSGVAVPLTVLRDGKPETRWQLYLRWGDGRREARPLAGSVERPDGGRLWLVPTPAAPPVNTPSGWSAESRRGWLKGEPAPNPAALFRDLCEAFADYLEFPEPTAAGSAATLALWTLLCYGYPAWPAVPYLYVGGPVASGKSRVFDILGRLVFRSLASSNLTGPTMFRTLHDRGGVLLYDEAERLRQATPDVQELLSMLLAGYKRGGQATRLEPIGDTYRPVSFDVYGPKAVACIQGLPPALASRCIPLMMFRAPPDSPKPRRRPDAEPERWRRLQDRLHVLALESGPDWSAMSADAGVVPGDIGGRDYELWQPLLALAKWVESHGARGLLGLMQSHAARAVGAAKDDAVPEADETLLELLAEAVMRGDRPSPGDLLSKAKDRDPATFDRWAAATVTRRLKQYDIPTPKKSNGVRRFVGVTAATLARVQRCYGIDLGVPDGTDTHPEPATLSDPE